MGVRHILEYAFIKEMGTYYFGQR